jgi:hypothetical protein
MSLVPITTKPVSNHPPAERLVGSDILTIDLDTWVAQQEQARQFAEIAAQRQFIAEYKRRMNAPRFPTIRSAGEMLSFVIQQAGELLKSGSLDAPLVLDGYCLDVYQQLASYFSGDYQTFPCKLNPRKGILLVGNYGVGKSLAMRLFANNPVRPYRLVSSRSISEAYRLNGDVCEYKQRLYNPSSVKFFGHAELGLCIGDFGAERTDSRNYGSGFSVGDLILDRYDNSNLRGWTHAETNGTPDDLMQAYGPRVNDRLFEMFNVLKFSDDAPSRRS